MTVRKPGNDSPKLTPATIRLIDSIKSKEIQSLLTAGVKPSDAVEGWYYALAMAIWHLQEGRGSG